ncbi:hypothetical protein Rta_18830 [Ramlibacter tataouinensis TTB310]|uniref:Uncharacterized protein n=1 Tax=Ramlibacter tataouinensis (strain ATCC BAA-407 / DSM 14655 / LMG 21543 / TTB310) TaxID=365046 RepID=F5XX30_RAMTT|nr:hypothetical protein Rta_18830 [Ramlibacter tataouinensis TTB310]
MLLALGSGAAQAQTQTQAPDALDAELARISAERRQAEARFAAEEKACYARFAVNDCIAEARARQRAAAADLRRQENSLAEEQRRRRGAERREELRERADERDRELAQRRAGAAMQQESRDQDGTRKGTQGAPRADSTPRRAERLPSERPAVDEAGNRRAHEERVREALQRKERVQERAAQRAKRAQPLPVPP